MIEIKEEIKQKNYIGMAVFLLVLALSNFAISAFIIINPEKIVSLEKSRKIAIDKCVNEIKYLDFKISKEPAALPDKIVILKETLGDAEEGVINEHYMSDIILGQCRNFKINRFCMGSTCKNGEYEYELVISPNEK